MFKYMHIGGLRFLRIGRLQLSFCICKRKPSKPLTDLELVVRGL